MTFAAIFDTPAWTRARDALSLAAMALGDPQAIMNLCYPNRRQKREILSWLAPLETLVRKLLLIAAAALPVARTHARPSARALASRAAQAEPAPKPLRASFRLIAPRGRGFTNTPTPRRLKAPAPAPRIGFELSRSPAFSAPPKQRRGRLLPAVRLALRYQALLKVLENPLPYARCLARRLRRRPVLAQAIAEERARHDTGYLTRDIALTDMPGWDAAGVFTNSS